MRYPSFVWLLLLCGMLCGCAPAEVQVLHSVRYHVGDEARWAAPDFDDALWKTASVLALPYAPAVLWLRADVDVDGARPLGLDIAGVVAREVYWDGVYIGAAGRVGRDANSESVGPIDAVFAIPDTLAEQGTHTLAVRISSFRRPASTSGLLMQIKVGPYAILVKEALRSIALPLLFLGGFVLIALYYAVLYVADRTRLPYLLTSVLCGTVAALLVAESWRNAVGYTYDVHGMRIAVIEGLTWAVGLLLVATFAASYRMPHRWLLIGALGLINAIALGLIADHETGTLVVFACSLGTALVVTGWAVWQHQTGARWALAGVGLCVGVLVATGYEFMDDTFFPAFGLLLAGLLTALGLQTREDRRRHTLAQARAARLEAELLKKHLQPHFLMNTLTSLMEWVETDPVKGAGAMDALAAELRMLVDVSGMPTITMRQEVALCRAHLDVMSYRKACTFELTTADVNLAAPIPPAIIHTLVENAVTHNAYPPGHIVFTLRETTDPAAQTLTLATPLANPHRSPRGEGSGTRYIRARLEEAFPCQWTFEAGPQDAAWVTRITLPNTR